MPKRVIRTSQSVALLAVRQGEPTDPLTEADSALIGDPAKCTQWFALSAGTRRQYRSDLAVTDPSTAATASAVRVAEPADAIKLLQLGAS